MIPSYYVDHTFAMAFPQSIRLMDLESRCRQFPCITNRIQCFIFHLEFFTAGFNPFGEQKLKKNHRPSLKPSQI